MAMRPYGRASLRLITLRHDCAHDVAPWPFLAGGVFPAEGEVERLAAVFVFEVQGHRRVRVEGRVRQVAEVHFPRGVE